MDTQYFLLMGHSGDEINTTDIKHCGNNLEDCKAQVPSDMVALIFNKEKHFGDDFSGMIWSYSPSNGWKQLHAGMAWEDVWI